MEPNVEDLLAQVQRQQQEIERIQRGVAEMVVEGGSRQDEVRVKVRGNGQFTEIDIDPDVLRRSNAHELGDILVEAVNDGLAKMAAATKARFAPVLEQASTPPGQ